MMIEQELHGVLERYEHAWNAHDMEALCGVFGHQAHCINTLGLHWVGREEIRAALAALHASVHRVSELSLRPTHVRTCGDGVAVVYAVWELTGQRGIDDQVLAPRKGVLTTLLERRDGGWLIQTYHETAVANPQRTVAPGRAGE